MKTSDSKTALEKFCRQIYQQIEAGEPPKVVMPSRSTTNITYDPQTKQYVLGEKKIVRKTTNLRMLKPFAQLVWVAKFAHALVSQHKTSTLGDVYYSAQADGMTFKKQQESNTVITELETILNKPREAFNIFAEERSAIFGDLTIEYTVPRYKGKRFNLTAHPDGLLIGPSIATSKLIKCNADKIIAIEKGGLFSRFVEENVHEKFNALLIQIGGQAPRTTRAFIRKLHEHFKIPVYILTDADPWGMHIAMVIISGSANAAHLKGLTTPNAKWIGVKATDIIKYKLPSDPLTEEDIRRLHELEKDPRYSKKTWQKQIQTFLKHRRKSELEAFCRYGLTFIVDTYLRDKLKS